MTLDASTPSAGSHDAARPDGSSGQSDDAARHQLIESIVHEALPLADAAREAHLQARCGDDAALRAAVNLLLAPTDPELDDFLARPALRRCQKAPVIKAAAPRRIGRYEIVRVIGEGGMGVVYEARQQQPRRTVALKIVRPGVATHGLLRRFEHEAEILGQLHHPGIACIYEAGVADAELEPDADSSLGAVSQPYFAMEFVHGRTITAYCLEQNLTPRDRLTLFARVCDAVQHAHHNGVIHRDLKPANILVQESTREPKILDFGVARLTNADLQTVTLRTDAGQLIGTLAYMSPEQVSGDPRQLDTRSDVYALGVILYELLAGRLPHNIRNCSIPESMRILREEEPSRLGSTSALFRGDIETIVAKAIEKDKHARYSSAAELAADLRRYLADEPIVARPASRYYRFRKFTRRHKALVAGISAAMIFLSVGLALAVWQWSVATRARDAERYQHELADIRAAEAQRQAYRASLAAAQAAIRSDDIVSAGHSLDEADVALRGWEWSYFRRLADPPSITLSTGGRLRETSISHDAARVFVHTWDGLLSVWDVATAKVIRTFKTSGDDGWAATPDGRGVAIAMANELACLEVDSGRVQWKKAMPVRLTTMSFRADGEVLAVAPRAEPRIALLDARTGAEIGSVALSAAQVGRPRLSPDGSIVISSHGSFNDAFDVATGAHLFGFNSSEWMFTGDGKRILNPGNVIDLGSGQELVVLKSEVLGPGKRAERPDGTALASVNVRGVVTLVEPKSMQPYARLRSAGDYAFGFSGNARKLLTATASGTIKLYDASFVSLPLVVPMSHQEEVDSAAVGRIALPEGLREAVATGAWGCVCVRDPVSGAPRWRRSISHQDVNALAFSHSGRILAAAGWKGSIALMDTATGALLSRRMAGNDSDIWALAFSADDTQLYVASAGGTVRAAHISKAASTAPTSPDFGDLATTEWKTVFNAERGDVSVLATSLDGRLLAIGTGHAYTPRPYGDAPTAKDGRIEVWDVSGGRRLGVIEAHRSSILSMVFDSTGAVIASASADGTVALWSVPEGRRLVSLDGRAGPMYSVCLSPDGTRIAAGAHDGTIRLWDRPTGQALCGISDVATAAVLALRFSADGRTLIGSALQAPLLVLETEPLEYAPGTREWVERARRLTDRLSRQGLTSRQIARTIQDDSTLPESLRQCALQFCAAWGDNPNWLNSDAWKVCRRPGLTLQEYKHALQLARDALELLPDPAILNTLGTAQYRTGMFREAIDLLRRSDSAFSQSRAGSQAANWLVIAMAQWRLGEGPTAHQSLAEGLELMREPSQGRDEDNRALAEEARQLLRQPDRD